MGFDVDLWGRWLVAGDMVSCSPLSLLDPDKGVDLLIVSDVVFLTLACLGWDRQFLRYLGGGDSAG
jgi:predicted acylesterase/phospholipase RssA